MKKTAILLISLLIAFVTGCQDHNMEPHPEDVMAWRAGGPAEDAGRSIAVDQSGNIYVTGIFSGTATFGTTTLTSIGLDDVFVVKYNSNGDVQWGQRIGGSLDDDFMDITVDGNSNVYLSAQVNGSIFVAKYNSSGEVQWVRNSSNDGPFTIGYDIATDMHGNVYVAGQFSERITFGTTTLASEGGIDAFIVKYNSEGEVLWAQKVANLNHVSATGITVDESGNPYITGFFQGTTTFGSISLTSDFTSTTHTIFIAKYSSTGEALWAQGGDIMGYGTGIAVDGNGNAYITGSLTMNRFESQIYFAKYNINGERQWSKYLGTIGITNRAEDIAVDNNGNVYLTGFTASSQLIYTPYPFPTSGEGQVIINLTHYGGEDVFVGKFNSDGNLHWTRTAGGTGNDYGYGITVDDSGTVYTTGRFQGTATFGTTTLTSVGGSDMFVAKFK